MGALEIEGKLGEFGGLDGLWGGEYFVFGVEYFCVDVHEMGSFLVEAEEAGELAGLELASLD